MARSMEWEQLPAAVRHAVERHAGPVMATSPGGHGTSTDIRLVLHSESGDVFVKGTHPGVGELERDRLALGVDLAPYVTPLGPPLLWRVQAGCWDVTGWPVLPGRLADLSPGSSDISLLAGLLAEVSVLQAPEGVPLKSVREDWGYYSDNPASLDGDNLVHTDPTGGTSSWTAAGCGCWTGAGPCEAPRGCPPRGSSCS